MREVTVSDAQNGLGALLDLVEAGEEVVITRDGKRLARLVLDDKPRDRAKAIEAAARIIERRKGMSLGGITIKELIEEGRR